MVGVMSRYWQQQHAKHHGCVRATFEVEQIFPMNCA